MREEDRLVRQLIHTVNTETLLLLLWKAELRDSRYITLISCGDTLQSERSGAVVRQS